MPAKPSQQKPDTESKHSIRHIRNRQKKGNEYTNPCSDFLRKPCLIRSADSLRCSPRVCGGLDGEENRFFGKPCPNRPVDSLRCLPVPLSALFCTPVCNLTILNFCCSCCFVFFRGRTAVSRFSPINRFQLVFFARGAACPPCIPLRRAESARP